MNKTVKALLLSGLVFPGLGSFVNGRRKTGGLLMVLTAFSMLFFIVGLLSFLARMFPLDGSYITPLEAQAYVTRMWVERPIFLNMWMWVMTGLWGAGLVDAVLTARGPTAPAPPETH